MTELCELAYKYGSDKCPQINHTYTTYYYDLLKDRRDTIKKVVEIGIGSSEYMHYTPEQYQTGASLRMWRDFFPNAQIYGADIQRSMLFEDERIKTFYCDQGNTKDIENLISETGSDIDLFIDDGFHLWGHQVHLCRVAMPLLDKNVIYIIEDVSHPKTIQKYLTEAGYECYEIRYPKEKHLPKDRMMMVRHKQ